MQQRARDDARLDQLAPALAPTPPPMSPAESCPKWQGTARTSRVCPATCDCEILRFAKLAGASGVAEPGARRDRVLPCYGPTLRCLQALALAAAARHGEGICDLRDLRLPAGCGLLPLGRCRVNAPSQLPAASRQRQAPQDVGRRRWSRLARTRPLLLPLPPCLERHRHPGGMLPNLH